MARQDPLTGLVNRRVFVEAVEQEIARARWGERSFAVLYLDLDNFKDVNDALGHPAGDLLLEEVARRLLAGVRGDDLVARFGGDEFAVIVAGVTELTAVASLAERLGAALREPFTVEGSQVCPGASIGIAVYGPDVRDAETVLAHADVALYRAKSEGRGTHRFFTAAMDDEVRTRVLMASDLREAIARGQLFLVYQPQVEPATRRVVGLEALVRWSHPGRGNIGPGEFVPVAERMSLAIPLGRWVLREACRQARVWMDEGIATPTISVNVSALQFKTLEIERALAVVLEETHLPPERLELELTESVLMEASAKHGDLIARLRKKGLHVAIDDFGTGFSSLEYLSRFPVDRLKIAQSFVGELARRPEAAAIIKATIGLAKELKLGIVAEGVEDEEQLRLLTAWGCSVVQGHYFFRPLTTDQATALLRGGPTVLAA
jgi:diguanylate cyclase (GGDEF)-like protein